MALQGRKTVTVATARAKKRKPAAAAGARPNPRQPKSKAPPVPNAPAPAWIRCDEDLRHALTHLTARDPLVVGHMLELAGQPPLRAREPALAGLVWIIVSQQVSTASARAIFERVRTRFPDITHRDLLQASDEDLRTCGLSAPKMRTLRHLAQAIDDGSLDLDALAHLDPLSARERMTAVKGIGPWTADIYLLFCLGHPDVWPAGDLALQEGAKLALRLRSRPDARKLERLSARWQPYRAVAARLIWAYYGVRLEQKRAAARPQSKT